MLQNPTSAATLPRLDAEKEGVQPSIRPLLAARRPRPRAAVGTCPYHWWLTSFGAEVIGAKPPERWSEDLANVRTVGALSGLWLGLREHGPAVGLTLTGWRRLPDGLSYRDPRTGIHVLVPAGGLQLTPGSTSGSAEWMSEHSSSPGLIECHGRVLGRSSLAGPPSWLLQHPQRPNACPSQPWC